MIKWLFKWALRIFVLAVVAVVLLLVFKDTILCKVAEHQIHAETGMDVKIGRFSSGLFSPVVTIENLKLYNTPEFGGTEFLIVPELHLELDPDALSQRKLRIKLMRLNLSELDIVKNQAGKTNIVSMLANVPKGKLAPQGVHVGTKQMEFQGIDVLNISIGRRRYLDLKHPENNQDVPINLENEVFNNVKTDGDLTGVLIMLYLHSDGALMVRPGNILSDYLTKKTSRPKRQLEATNAPPRRN